MNPSQVSVVVPTYRSLHLFRRTIASLELQEPKPDEFQVVAIDDGSGDETGEWLRGYNGPLNMTPLVLDENLGRARVRNHAVKHTDRDILLFIDGDMAFGSDVVAKHAALHTGKKLAAMGRVIYEKKLRGSQFARYLETRGPLKLKPGDLLPGRYFLSGHVSMPRILFEEVGGFDSSFREYGGEDLDLGMRLVKTGAEIRLFPDIVTSHLHLRTLDNLLEGIYKYGLNNIPILVHKHPELVSELRLNWPEANGIEGLLRRLVISRIPYGIIRALTLILNHLWVPDRMFDYLIFRNYNKGYRTSLKNVADLNTMES